jgi:hypothetical protein
MTEQRTIQMDMTWRYAAKIIAAALENGTGKGQEMARAELFRMAEMLDQLRDQQTGQTDLYEVIASDPESRKAAYGVTFTDEATATAYAERLEHCGYAVDPFPAYQPEPSLAAALASAGRHFKDPRLNAEPEAGR